jgi:hypothetical protein
MTHLDTSFHDHEMAIDTPSDRAWSRWIRDVEKLLGIDDLDGNDCPKAGPCVGYSLDGAYDAYEAGKSPATYAVDVNARRVGLGLPRLLPVTA